jgi:hypothetical protein
LQKKKSNEKNGDKNWLKKTWWWNLNEKVILKMIPNKINSNKIKRNKFERLKNYRGWNWKTCVIWYIIYRLKNSRGEIEKYYRELTQYNQTANYKKTKPKNKKTSA